MKESPKRELSLEHKLSLEKNTNSESVVLHFDFPSGQRMVSQSHSLGRAFEKAVSQQSLDNGSFFKNSLKGIREILSLTQTRKVLPFQKKFFDGND